MTTHYTKDHEWIRLDGDVATVGITEHAQEQLCDIVYVELPEIGRSDRRAIASLAGLAPHISQSGNAPPRAAISGGRPRS